MADIVAPTGSPLAAAVLSCEHLAATRNFYCERIGFDAGPIEVWTDAGLSALVGASQPVTAQACLLTAGERTVGRLLLLEFADGAGRPLAGERIHPEAHSRAIGLNNLNFYADNARAAAATFQRLGHEVWSEPTAHSLSPGVGRPIEVLFTGPDGVAINLVELASTDANTRIGQMRAYVERHGRTRAGFTPVVTSSHVVRSMPKARRFYERVLRMGVLIDEELSAPAANAFLRLPADARTHLTFMQGNHMFGKLALSEPLNYLSQCLDLAPRARAPNRGYLAQIFEIDDVGAAYWACREVGGESLTTPTEWQLPGFGRRRAFAVRVPGSGALQWIIARGGASAAPLPAH
jgi:catechol 2,3-dioxygenase-like lactoylglutathione lyase family enzyme